MKTTLHSSRQRFFCKQNKRKNDMSGMISDTGGDYSAVAASAASAASVAAGATSGVSAVEEISRRLSFTDASPLLCVENDALPTMTRNSTPRAFATNDNATSDNTRAERRATTTTTTDGGDAHESAQNFEPSGAVRSDEHDVATAAANGADENASFVPARSLVRAKRDARALGGVDATTIDNASSNDDARAPLAAVGDAKRWRAVSLRCSVACVRARVRSYLCVCACVCVPIVFVLG